MKSKTFPERIRSLPKFEGPFEAMRLAADRCEILFASYPPGTSIASHQRDTDNHGVITKGELYLTLDGVESRFGTGDWYHVFAGQKHSARFETETAEIEFWFAPKP